MELTQALNYMKTIIDNGKKRKNNTINVRNGLKEYLSTLMGEGVIIPEDCRILSGVIGRIDSIMKSEMTVDEAFVRSMCGEEDTKYVSLESERGQVVQPTPVSKSSPKTSKKKSSVPRRKKNTEYHFSSVEEDSTPVRHSNPWDNFPITPDGSCGRNQDARRKAAWEEWHESLFHSDEGINPRCRH